MFVVCGADTIFEDGSFINKVGTRLLLIAAKETRTRVCILADPFKISPCLDSLDDIINSEFENKFSYGENIALWAPVFEFIPFHHCQTILNILLKRDLL
jgi:translation initiation factor 2B subunit (eIF-2B alpha/beta/delta family)